MTFAVFVQVIVPIVVVIVACGFAAYLGCRQALQDFFGESSWEQIEE